MRKFAQAQQEWKYYLIIVLMMMLPLVSYDIYLPAFSNIEKYYQVQMQHVQTTLSLYLLGYGIAQLIYGFFATRFSYKSVLIFGILLFLAATLGCLISPNIYYFTVFRFIQGLGACAGSVLGKVFALEIFKKNTHKAFTIIFPFVAASSAIAPPLGGVLTKYFDSWISVFVALFIFAIFLLLLVNSMLPSVKQKYDSIEQTVGDFLEIIKHPKFWGYSAMFIGIYQIWFVYIMESPYIFHHLGLTPEKIGLMYIPTTVACFIGNAIVRRLLLRISTEKILLLGLAGISIAALSYLIVLVFLNHVSVISVVFPMVLIIVSSGALAPIGIANALSLFPQKQSCSSAIIGFVQLSLGGAITLSLAHLTKNPAITLSITIIAILLVMLVLYKFLIFNNNEKILEKYSSQNT